VTDTRQRGDELAEPDPPPYPYEWGPDQRLTAYWQAVRTTFPRHQSGWYALLNQAIVTHDHIRAVLGDGPEYVDTTRPIHDQEEQND
jgi:hypothetical protein